MRSIRAALLGSMLLAMWPPFAAAEATAGPATHPLAQFLREMRAATPWLAPGATPVTFVLGNDLWQSGQRYQSGRDWLALTCRAGGCALEPAALEVKPEFWQGHYDAKPTFGQRLSFRKEAGPASEALAWFHTAKAHAWLKPGAVPTYYSPHQPLKQPPTRGTLEAMVGLPNRASAWLVPMLVTAETQRRLVPELRDQHSYYVLQLRAQGKRQLLEGQLGFCTGTFHPRKYLQWAGDLDRDGKADYLISFVDQDGPVHLYLSSAAKPGALVGLAGVYKAPPHGGECGEGQLWEE